MTAPFHAGEVAGYARDGQPTMAALERAVGALEEGVAVAFSSGMAAAAALLEDLPVGARVLAPDGAYQGTRELLGRRQAAGRLSVTLVDIADTDAVDERLDGVDLLWIESPTNPLVEVADIPALVEAAHRAGARVVVDSTLATPLLQQPLQWGADAVLHSATKFLSGHSDLISGVVVVPDQAAAEQLVAVRTITGALPGSLESFLVLRGLRTLPVRLERAQENATELARRLEAHGAVECVHFPGLPGTRTHDRARRLLRGPGAVLSFELRAGAEAADRLCQAVEVITHATSLGGVESLIERRSRYPSEAHLPPGLLRLSVGCEHIEDLWDDLRRGLPERPG
jgi:cystathionine gamma-synthase